MAGGGLNISNDKKVRCNDDIRALEVRLIDSEGNQLGVVSIKTALEAAQAASLDLVEISPTAKPPVCKVMDFGKYVFEQKKRSSAAKKKQVQVQLKEIKFRPTTDEGDYQVKLRNLIRFLNNGDKAKVTIRYRGREMAHQELGKKIADRLVVDLEPYGTVEQTPKMEGRQMVMIFGPIKKKK